MATIIEQKPKTNSAAQAAPYFKPTVVAVGQDVIFAVSNDTIVANQIRVKFVAQVYISDTSISIGTSSQLIGTFKTTPNNAGVGIFDFSSLIENYTEAENEAFDNSQYKLTDTTADTPHSMHLIDKFSRNKTTARYLAVVFGVEYYDNTPTSSTYNTLVQPSNQEVTTLDYMIFNAYLKYSDILELAASNGKDFGYSFEDFWLTDNTKKFLSNAPTTQYANKEDYGTVAFFNPILFTVAGIEITKIQFKLYDSSGSQLGSDIDVENNNNTGGYTTWNAKIYKQILYAGVFPGNLRNWSSDFRTHIDSGDLAYYTFQAFTSSTQRSALYTININCPDLRGYESIRLAWLNQWGAWDYYTFTKKSTKTISTKGTTYNQLRGSWNEAAYRPSIFRGGKRAFRVNATEKIKMNTDFISESEAEWFEDLINSPEVYILEGYQTDITDSLLNNYVTPVRLITKSYEKKTIANDKLIQYTFEVEKSKTFRTQSV